MLRLAIMAQKITSETYAQCRRLGYSAADAKVVALRAKSDFWNIWVRR